MDLFELFKITTKCVLCGGQVSELAIKETTQALQHLALVDPQPKSKLACHQCQQRLPLTQFSCFCCGLPFAKGNQSTPSIGKNCGSCLAKTPNYDRTISAFHYEYPINDCISQLKYTAQLHYLPLLSSYLIAAIKTGYSDMPLPDLVIPVPLHKKKLAQRGFNQSRLIARQLANWLPIKIATRGIERTKFTQAQSGLDSNERQNNVKGAFQITAEIPAHVAIIDDVITTGMTVSELSKQARMAGAKTIDVWCIARAYEL
jgi:ComF family protein